MLDIADNAIGSGGAGALPEAEHLAMSELELSDNDIGREARRPMEKASHHPISIAGLPG